MPTPSPTPSASDPAATSEGAYNAYQRANSLGTTASTNTYDNPFGLPTGLGSQPILVGQKTRTNEGAYHEPVENTLDVRNVNTLMQRWADIARGPENGRWQAQQQLLALAGMYGSSAKYTPGQWTNNDISALQTAYQGYLASGSASKLQSFDEYLYQQAGYGVASGADGSGGGAGGSGGAGPAPVGMSTTNNYGDTAAQQELGRSLDSGQQSALNSAVNSNTDDSPSAIARSFVVNNNLPEYAAHQVTGYMNAFANMFLSGQSSRAQTGVGDVAVGTSG